MYLWRKRTTSQWWNRNQETLWSQFGQALAVIERPDRKQLEIQVVCDSPKIVKGLGGTVEKLPRNWLKRFARSRKTRPIRVRNRRLVIPAGMAFGTGEHATTAMSLRMLEHVSQNWKPGWSIVDLGTGSGILALAARCLGAGRVIGIDLDPIAISTAGENARRTKIEGVDFRVADARRWKIPRRLDVVTANLFSDLLIEVLPKVRSAHRLILSGVLHEQEPELIKALQRNKIDIVGVRRRGKWVAILATGSPKKV